MITHFSACFQQAWVLRMLLLCTLNTIAIGQSDDDFRLASLSGGSLSRLEIYNSGSWSAVCAQNWGVRESLVLCTQLGFGFVGYFAKVSEGVVKTVRLGDVRCGGYESSILDCHHSPLGVATECNVGVVTVYCTENPGATVLLRGGESYSEGRVEIRVRLGNETLIYTICDEDWDLDDAQAVCTGRESSYDSAIKAVRGSYFGEYPRGQTGERFDGFLTSSVRCNASYDDVLSCPNSGWFPSSCPSGNNAGVICKTFPDTYQFNVALSGGSSLYNGVVKVSINDGPSGSICDNNLVWTLREGDVTCRSLGYGYALNVSLVDTDLEPIVNSVYCDGDEESLSQCFRGGSCVNRADLAPTVNCSGPLGTNDHPLELNNRVQVSRGDTGLLRVFSDGRWGTVCSTGWTQENAKVACRQLGYGSVISYLDSRYGRGPIYLSNVRCKGTEQRLDQCQHDGWGVHVNCSHYMDVGLQCGTASMMAVNAMMVGLLVLVSFISSE